MDLQLKGKVIIVSGGAKGIGFGIVKQLAAEKAIPVIIGRNAVDNKAAIVRSSLKLTVFRQSPRWLSFQYPAYVIRSNLMLV